MQHPAPRSVAPPPASRPLTAPQTAQLLEALHAHDSISASSYPRGLLIANDSDYKRTHMLIHQAARLPSPALIVTNHDASIYPAIKIPSEQVVFPTATKPRVAAKKQYQLLFDRILCDVPCSGDGTLRKNVAIWKNWQPMDGNGLHRYAPSRPSMAVPAHGAPACRPGSWSAQCAC